MGRFHVVQLVSEVYLSIGLHAHTEERILAHIRAFNADLRIPMGFFDFLSSFLMSIKVFDYTHMRRREFSRISRRIARI